MERHEDAFIKKDKDSRTRPIPIINTTTMMIPEAASTSKKSDALEANRSKSSEIKKIEPPNVEPMWLLPFLKEMKETIKKEVLDEVLHLTMNSSCNYPDLPKEGSKPNEGTQNISLSALSPEVVHEGIYCDHCDQLIYGIRYKCGDCIDYDLCQHCENIPNIHDKRHIFLKIRYPFALKLKQRKTKQENADLTKDVFCTSISDNDKQNAGGKPLQTNGTFDAMQVRDETVSYHTIVAPSAKFTKRWRVINTGDNQWNSDTKLYFINGHKDLVPENYVITVPQLNSGEEGDISVSFTAPLNPGFYQSLWRFRHKNLAFGVNLHCFVSVLDDKKQGVKDVDERVFAFEKNDKEWAELFELGKQNLMRTILSHTATPNNTPFDITPPKSPDHCEAGTVKETTDFTTWTSNSKPDKGPDVDENCSILSVNSSDSETEFVIIPMPKCFNMSESFVTRSLPHLNQPVVSDTLEISISNNNEQPKAPVKDIQSSDNSLKKIVPVTKTVSQETGVPELAEDSHSLADQPHKAESKSCTPVENVLKVEKIEKQSALSNVKNDVPNCVVDNGQKKDSQDEGQTESVAFNTFPKYPIEGISTAVFPPLEERTIQVLPEGLVTGALSAAASVYNTARAVISTIQQPRNESMSDPSIEGKKNAVATEINPNLEALHHLLEMGFLNHQQNTQLLQKHNGDVASVVAELVNLSDKDWNASRQAGVFTEFD